MWNLLSTIGLVCFYGCIRVRSEELIDKCDYSPMELILVVDRSTSIYVKDVRDYLFPNLFEPLAKVANLGSSVEEQSRVGIVSWGVTTVADKQLSSTNSEDVMLNELAAIYGLSRSESGDINYIYNEEDQRYQHEDNTGTYTYDALEMVEQDVAAKSKLRPYLPVVVVVVTDGQSADPARTAEAAASLRKHLAPISAAKVVAIGIGDATREELEAIASSPDDVFDMESYTEIETNVDKIFGRLCVNLSAKNVTMLIPLLYAYVSGTSDMFLATDMNVFNAKETTVREDPNPLVPIYDTDAPVKVGVYPEWPRSVAVDRPFQPYSEGDLDGMYQAIHDTFTSIPTLNEAIEIALKDLTRRDYGQFLIITVTRPLSTTEVSETTRILAAAKKDTARLRVIIQGGGCASRDQLESLGADLIANNHDDVRDYVDRISATDFTEIQQVFN